jgi:hypothetical protein
VVDTFGRISERLPGEYFLGQFPAALVPVGIVGLLYLFYGNRPAALLLTVPFLGWSAHGLLYTFVDFYIFFIPAYLMFGLFVAAGAGFLLRGVEGMAGGVLSRKLPAAIPATAVPVLLAALLLAIPLAGVPETYPDVDRSDDYRGREIIENVAREAEQGATVLHHRSNLWYMVLVERRRRDLTLVDPFNTAWVRYTDMVWPAPVDRREAAARYGTGDENGVEAARLTARKGPVYLLNQDDLNTGAFERAGFEVIPADDEGILYELIPQGNG